MPRLVLAALAALSALGASLAQATEHIEIDLGDGLNVGAGWGELTPDRHDLRITLTAPAGKTFYNDVTAVDSTGSTMWGLESSTATTRTFVSYGAQEDEMGWISVSGTVFDPADPMGWMNGQSFSVRVSNALWPCASCPYENGMPVNPGDCNTGYVCDMTQEGRRRIAVSGSITTTVTVHHGLPGTLTINGGGGGLEILNLDNSPFTSAQVAGSGVHVVPVLIRAAATFSGEVTLTACFLQDGATLDSEDVIQVQAVRATFDPNDVTLGYWIVRNRVTDEEVRRIVKARPGKRVTVTVEPKDEVANVTIQPVGTTDEHVALRTMTVNADAGTISFTLDPLSGTRAIVDPMDPMMQRLIPDPNAIVIEALWGGTSIGEMQVIVIVPTWIEGPPFPEANGPPTLVENLSVDRSSRPPFPDISVDNPMPVTIHGHRLTIQVQDQFRNNLDDLYEGAAVWEQFPRQRPGFWLYIKLKLSPTGTYRDPVGFWVRRPPTPAPLRDGEQLQEIDVRVGGHNIAPQIVRRVIATTNPDNVEIQWPPQQ